MDLKLLHITHDSQLWAGCRRELALCCVLVWLVNVKMWYQSFSKHSWLEKSGHSGGKVNKISPSVPESWRECEWQRHPAAIQGSMAPMAFQYSQNSWIPICQEPSSSLQETLFSRFSNTESTKRATNLTNNKVGVFPFARVLSTTCLLHVTLPYE